MVVAHFDGSLTCTHCRDSFVVCSLINIKADLEVHRKKAYSIKCKQCEYRSIVMLGNDKSSYMASQQMKEKQKYIHKQKALQQKTSIEYILKWSMIRENIIMRKKTQHAVSQFMNSQVISFKTIYTPIWSLHWCHYYYNLCNFRAYCAVQYIFCSAAILIPTN